MVSLLLLGWVAACVPLGDLDAAGAEYDADGNQVADSGGGGGGGDQATCTTCMNEVCGDGVQQADEECDDAGVTPRCTADCHLVTCPEGCDCFGRNGSNYVLCNDVEVVWEETRTRCESFGMSQLAIGNEAENTFTAHRMSRAGVPDAWTGASDAAVEGTWLWPDGTAFWRGTAAGEPLNGSFTNWQPPGEPNNAVEANEDCLRFDSFHLWYDDICSQNQAAFCESRREIPESCGDARLDDVEACDDGKDSTSCDGDCTAARCGDGYVNAAAGEDCDDSNADDLDDCSNDCAATGIVGHWPFMERSADVGADLSRYAAHGRFINGVFGGRGMSLNEMSTNQYMGIPAKPVHDFRGPFTISLHAMPFVAPDRIQTLVWRPGAANSKVFLRLNYGQLEGGSVIDDATSALAVAPVGAAFTPLQTWNHFALTFDGTTYRLYWNGSKIGELASALEPPAANGGFVVGSEPGGDVRPFFGVLANLRIYDRELSGDELLTLATPAPR
ncbi:MAG TPA: LamG-like jellyroll fold domain-containing protein [Polyangiaceae bacterium]|nr:LamG-like jellyroll fold domain-containing protein [Polyangiaceae bacterium]